MGTAVLGARFILIVVFATAALSKLGDRAGLRKTVVDFGVPVVLSVPVAFMLPLAELAVVGALIPPLAARWGALAALGLLSLFITGIGVSLARKRTPECRCFGQFHSAQVGWSTLARNGALALLAAFVAWQGFAHPELRPSSSWPAELLTAATAALLLWFLINLTTQQGRLLVRIEALETSSMRPGSTTLPAAHGLPVGSLAPDFRLPGLRENDRLTLRSLRVATPVVLIFTDADCRPCNELVPDIVRWQQPDHAAALTVAVISRGHPKSYTGEAEVTVRNVLIDEDHSVAHSYGCPGTPSAVAVDSGGTIGSPIATGAEAIRELVSDVLARSADSGSANHHRQTQRALIPANALSTHRPRPAVVSQPHSTDR